MEKKEILRLLSFFYNAQKHKTWDGNPVQKALPHYKKRSVQYTEKDRKSQAALPLNIAQEHKTSCTESLPPPPPYCKKRSVYRCQRALHCVAWRIYISDIFQTANNKFDSFPSSIRFSAWKGWNISQMSFSLYLILGLHIKSRHKHITSQKSSRVLRSGTLFDCLCLWKILPDKVQTAIQYTQSCCLNQI